MKRFKFLSVIVAVVFMIAVVGCSTVRYDEGYGEDVYQAAPYYSSIYPYSGYYAYPYSYGYGYSRPYNGRYYRENRRVEKDRRGNEASQQRTWNPNYRQQRNTSPAPSQNVPQRRNWNEDRNSARNRIFGS